MPDCGIYATLWVPFLFYILPPVFLLTLVPFRYYSFRRRNRHFFPHPHDILSGQSVLWGISIPWNGSRVHVALHNAMLHCTIGPAYIVSPVSVMPHIHPQFASFCRSIPWSMTIGTKHEHRYDGRCGVSWRSRQDATGKHSRPCVALIWRLRAWTKQEHLDFTPM